MFEVLEFASLVNSGQSFRDNFTSTAESGRVLLLYPIACFSNNQACCGHQTRIG